MLLLLMVLTSLSAWANVPGSGTEDDPYVVTTWGDLKEKMATGGYIRLDDNVTDPTKSSDSYLEVPSGKEVTLDLNGHTIDRGLTEATANGYVINVVGTLTVNDSSNPSTGSITGGNAADNGGGVYVVKDGTFTMSGGTISGNSASWAGGVDVYGTFTMTGGEISSNTARVGGGVSVDWSGAFTMTGGKISNNTAINYGGGVLVDMSDSFTVSGSAFVSGNARADGSADNVYIYWATITVDGLSADASIGVTTDPAPKASEPVMFATGATADDAARFFGDDPAFAVERANGDLRLKKLTTAWDLLQAQLDEGGTVTLTSDVTATAHDVTLTVTKAVTLDLNGHTIDADGRFGIIEIRSGGNLTLTNSVEGVGTITGGKADLGGGVYVDEGGAFTMNGGTISGNTASVGGGVGVAEGGTFTMTGGTISGNSATWAGGVEVYGTFTMSGGTISGNVADNYGGGVFVDGTFTVSGSPVIYGNTDSDDTASNVYLPSGSSITVDGLSADASIGVTTDIEPVVYSPVAFATGAAAGDETRFFGDDPALVVDNVNGELRLRPLMTWGLLQALLDAGGTVTLTDDIVATNGNASLSVTNAVTLDLNGHSITHNGNGCVINVRSGGDLTLTNSLAAGVVTGGAGGVYVEKDGTFTMAGGTISGNTTSDGGGVFVDSNGAFIMSGGEISGNTASKYGGGVYVRFYSSFTMSGGTISGNSASRSGGGVYVCNDVTFTMSGGEITGNAAAEGGGVSVFGRIAISGSPVVFGNTNSSGSANNVYLWARTFNASGLSAGTRIGVNTYDTPTLSSPVTIASGTSADDGAYFFSDDPAFAIKATTGVMYLVRVPTAWDLLQAQLNEGGTVTLTDDVTATARDATLKVSNTVTLDLNGHTIDAAGHFGVIEVCAGGDLTLTNSVEGVGAITGGGNAYEGGGVEVRKGGAFTMTGGTISGNSSTYASGVDVNGTFTMTGGTISNNTTTEAGGGVYVYDGTFTMSGGSITGNTASRDVGNAPAAATRDGGGVYIYGDGTFTMTGGTISGNMADSGGGGVYVCWGYFTMTGGTISGNTAGDEGGGVYMYDGTFTVSGSPVVSNNTNSVGAAKNVYLKDWFLENGCAITVSNLTEGAHIGVKTETAPTASNPVAFATGAAAGDETRFFSDDPAFVVDNVNGELRLRLIVHYIDADGHTKYCTNYTVLRTDNPDNLDFNDLPGGWYVVENWNKSGEHNGADFHYEGTLTFKGDVHLILCDGAEMSVSKEEDSKLVQSMGGTLTIYGQSGGTGRLSVTNTGSGQGIEAKYGVTINGGTISASISGSSSSRRAIGCSSGDVVINGGTVTATATGDANAIYGENVSILGGNVTANGTVGSRIGYDGCGTITLGWRSATDQIYATSYSGTVTIADGQSFYNGSEVISSGTIYDYNGGEPIGDLTKVNGKTLIGVDVLEDVATNDVAALATRLGGKQTNIVLNGRTLYKDGKWNTLCLPFNVELTADGCPLAGATARTVTAASIEGTTLNLTFGDAVTTLVAGTPYIIKWASGNNIVNPVFNGVTIDATDRSFTSGSGDTQVRFVGTYESTTFDATDYSILLMGGDNKLYYPTTDAGIGALRAYFKIGDGAALARQLTAFDIDFGETEQTGILSTTNDTNFTNSDGWFTLDGRKLNSMPTEKGIYIVNGKKVVIK